MAERKIKQISMRDSILKRSMWAGSNKMQSVELYIFCKETNKISMENVNYPPALIKLIDEIIVNAIDHYVVNPKLVNEIRISVNVDGAISVYNNGPGIKVEETKSLSGKTMYIPQQAFTEYLSGSNFDDAEDTERIVGGQNGLGAKITAVYSEWFKVETVDSKNKLFYEQTFLDGLLKINPPNIIDISKTKNTKNLTKEQITSHTEITFLPDYAKFNIKISEYIATLSKLIETRAIQAKIFTGIDVYYNGKKINISNFAEFCTMHLPDNSNLLFETVAKSEKYPNYPWNICLSFTEGKEAQVSMINGVCCPEGGTHIKHIQNIIVENLKSYVEKELKSVGVKFNKNLLLNNIFIFMKGHVSNPDFLSQTKDALRTPISNFVDYQIPNAHWERIWGMFRDVVMDTFLKKHLGATKLKANRQRIYDIAMYDDAKFCTDSKKCHECGLIITEGASAKGMADTGLVSKDVSEHFNYDWFGVFAVRGVIVNGLKESTETKKKRIPRKKTLTDSKSISEISDEINAGFANDMKEFQEEKEDDPIILDLENFDNIRLPSGDKDEMLKNLNIHIAENLVPNKKLIKNKRLEELVRVLGLDFNKKYEFTEQGEKEYKTLRYGFICGLTDQDLDGFNIFGLIATLFLTYWPNLVRRQFIKRINTPVIRIYPIAKTKHPVKEFYSEKQAKSWMIEKTEEWVSVHYHKPKYYKGLGTHTEAKKEVSRIFQNIDDKIITYILDVEAIRNMYIYYGSETLCRKLALSNGTTTEPLDDVLNIPLSQQFTIDTKSYQRDNIVRKLLNLVDGFVASRRKVFFTSRKIGHGEVKVAELASLVSAKANYHHGKTIEFTLTV